MSDKKREITREVVPDHVSADWLSLPTLKTQGRAQKYSGRLVVEIWEKQARTVFAGPANLWRQALQALEQDVAPSSLKSKPMTGPLDGQDFLGRVVVEVWEEETAVQIFGANSQELRERATKEIQLLNQ